MSETLKRPIVAGGSQIGGGIQSDEIFLSPRVVDRQAFNDFATQLRGLIDQTSERFETQVRHAPSCATGSGEAASSSRIFARALNNWLFEVPGFTPSCSILIWFE